MGTCSKQTGLGLDAADGSQEDLFAGAIGQPGIELWTKCCWAFDREHRVDVEARIANREVAAAQVPLSQACNGGVHHS